MLIFILIFIAIISITLVIVKRDENAFLLLGLCGSLILMFSGIIIYTAKVGGLSNSQEVFLFLSPKIRNWIQYKIITLDKLGYLIAIGRYLFPCFLLLIAVNYSMIPFIRRHNPWIKFLLLPPVFSLVLYYPNVFYSAVRRRFELQKVLMEAMLVWIFLYILLACFLLFYEYFSITMVYYNRKFRYILLSHISLALLYGLYCVQDPIQVYQLYNAQYLWASGLTYANPSLSMTGWVIISIATVLLVVVGFWNIAGYTQINFQADQEDIKLKRKFDTASMGASVFVHSIKNQLLSTRVVSKKINQAFSEESPNLEVLKGYTDMLSQLNESMLERMEELYRSIKSNTISITPVSVDKIVDQAINRFHQKFPEVEVWKRSDSPETVLADITHMGEAVYNLLVNAQEAIIASGNEPNGRVEVIIHNERLYVVIEVHDNGVGISKRDQKKIFDPFYTNKNTNYNWGMGLHYVRQIVKSHLGMLRLESIKGKGTSFFIMLPRYSKRKNNSKWGSKLKWLKK